MGCQVSTTQQLFSNTHLNSDTNAGKVITKAALIRRLNDKRVIVNVLQGFPHVQPLLNQIEEPPALVLKFLQDNLLKASNMRRLERLEIKFVARGVLETLNILHEAGHAHTGRIVSSRDY